MRLRLWTLAVAACLATGCQTEIRTGGIRGNVSPLDPDIIYFPPPNKDMTDANANNPNDAQHDESVAFYAILDCRRDPEWIVKRLESSRTKR
jgi:hypothetical protein